MAQHPFTTGRWLEANNLQKNENWHIARNEQNEVTSFCYVPKKDIKSIFLGTFPIYEISEGVNNRNHPEFFYGSLDHDFWPSLSDIFNLNTTNTKERLSLLETINIGISDILLETNRIRPFYSDDENLEKIKYNDICELLKAIPNIENIFITSGGVSAVPNLNSKKNVASWFKDYSSKFKFTGFNKKGYVKKIEIDGIPLKLIYIYSPGNLANTPIQGILNRNNNFGIPNMNIDLFRRYQWEYFIKKYHFNQVANIPQALMNFFEQ